MTARSISDLYTATFNSKEAQKYAALAYTTLRKLKGKEIYALYSYVDFIRTYHNNEEYERILPHYREAARMAKEAGDEELLRYVYDGWGKALIGAGKGADAVRLFQYLDAHSSDSIRPYVGLLGLSYMEAGNMDAAGMLMDTCLSRQDTDMSSLEALYRYYAEIGDYKSAFNSMQKQNSLDNRRISWKIRQNLTGSLTRLIDEEDRAHRIQTAAERAIWIISVTSGLFIMLFVGVWIAYRYRVQRLELATRLQAVENLTKDINQLKSKLDSANLALVQSEFKLIDEYCAEAYIAGDDDATKKKILRNLSQHIADSANSPDTIAKMEASANAYAGDVIARFRNQVPGLKDKDYAVFLYSVLGFSQSAMSVLVKATDVASIYNRRKRMRRKVREINPIDKSEFLTILGDSDPNS